MKTSSAKAKGRVLQNWVAKKVSELLGIPVEKDGDIEPRIMGSSGTDLILRGKALELFPFAVECFSENTLVVTKCGLTRIKDINMGDKVLTHKGRFRKVKNVFKRTARVGAISHGASSENLYVTPKHPFENFYCEWEDAHSITSVSHIIQSKNSYQTSKSKFKLPVMSHGNQNNIPKEVILDKDFMYFVGWYVAEGHCDNNRITFTLSLSEMNIAKKLSRISMDKFNNAGKIKQYKNNGITVFQINSVLISKFIKGLLNTGSSNKNLGQFLFYDKELLAELLSAYFEGDGCVGDDFARCETVSRILAYDIQFALLRYGIFSRVTVSKINRTKLLYSVQVSRATLSIFKSLYTLNDYRHTKAVINTDDRFIYAPYKQRIFTDASYTDENKTILVCNLEVEEDESYVVEGGIVVHNCKNQETWSIPKWMEQAQENQKEDTDWLLVCKRNRMNPVVVMDAEKFFELYKKILERS